MLTIAICEDDKMQQQQYEKLIHGFGLSEAIDMEKFDSGEALVEAYKNEKRFALILLDMQMNQLDGIQTAEIIRKYDKKCLIIIITALMEYAVKGYSIDAYDFILKPVNETKFEKVFRKAIKEIQVVMNKTYIIQSRDKTLVLRLSEIIFIESKNKKVIIHTRENAYTSNERISFVEKELEKDGFTRISRYYLVNIYHIKEIGVKTIIVSTGEEINYSSKYRDKIKSEYMHYMMEDL